VSKVFSGGGDVHYILPHFQREYTWDKQNWQTLLSDVFSVYNVYSPGQREPEHFLGALVVINDGTRNGTIPAFKLVDGQQRLTTLSLLLAALAWIIQTSNPPLCRKVRRMLLNNEDEKDTLRYKLLPTTKYGDRDAYLAIIEGQTPSQVESKIPVAFDYIYSQLQPRISNQSANPIDPERLFNVINNCLHVVFIDLDDNERPYEIFESLNGKGKPLTQADLVRNYLAIKLPEDLQEAAYQQPWSGIEQRLQEKRIVGRSRMGEITAFLRHYLAMRNRTLANEEHVYARFRDYTKDMDVSSFMAELNKLGTFADYYNRLLRPENEPDKDIRERLIRLDTLESATAYPFLLSLFEANSREVITDRELIESLDVLENYLVRRYLVGEPTNYLNKMFPALWRELDAANFVSGLQAVLAKQNYPSDDRLRRVIVSEPYYDNRSQLKAKIVLILEKVNRHLSSGTDAYTVLDRAATIEHIMPQNLSTDWKEMIGDNWEEVKRDYLHTLGNLTLVTQSWNSTLSNSPFAQKRAQLAGHGLRLNSAYFNTAPQIWNPEALVARGNWLADQIIAIWPQFGEVSEEQAPTVHKPIALIIQDERLEVGSWRDVLEKTLLWAVEKIGSLDAVAERIPTALRREPRGTGSKRERQLPNGWWMNVDVNKTEVKRYVSEILDVAGLAEEDYELETT